MIFFFEVYILINTLLYTKKVKTLINPNLILVSLWLIIILFYQFFCIEILGKLDFKVYKIIFIGIISYQFGLWLQYYCLKKHTKVKIIVNKRFNYKLLKYMTIFNIIFFFVYLHKIYGLIAIYFTNIGIYERIKLIHTYRAEAIGNIKYFVNFFMVFTIFLTIGCVTKRIKYNINFFINFFMMCFIIFILGKRLAIIVPMISIFFSIMLNYRWKLKEQIKIIFIIIILVIFSILFFYLLQIRFSKSFNISIRDLIPYFGMPLKSLEIILKEKIYENDLFFPNTLRMIYKLLNKITESNIEVIPTIRGYITYNGITTNTHTIYLTMLEDLNYKGILFFQFFYGNLFGFIFQKIKLNFKYYVLYCIWIEIILLQYAGDVFFPVLSYRIQQMFFIFFLNFIFFKKYNYKYYLKEDNSKNY